MKSRVSSLIGSQCDDRQLLKLYPSCPAQIKLCRKEDLLHQRKLNPPTVLKAVTSAQCRVSAQEIAVAVAHEGYCHLRGTDHMSGTGKYFLISTTCYGGHYHLQPTDK